MSAEAEITFPSDIQEAKLRIMQAVPYVRKSKQGDLPYAYASERDFILRVRPAMLANSVTVAPVACRIADSRTFTTKNGSTMVLRLVETTYRFTHVPSKTSEDVCVVGEGSDTLDKAAAKAMTQGLKYALRQWLLVETGDDPDKIAPFKEGEILSPAAEQARFSILECDDMEAVDVVEKRIAASSSIPATEKTHLSELMQNKRYEILNQTTETSWEDLKPNKKEGE